MITEKEVRYLAKLARISLKKSEIKKIQKDLSQILSYIQKLKEVEISDITPTSHSVLIENVMRADEIERSKIKGQNLIKLAPKTKNGYLKVKAIFS